MAEFGEGSAAGKPVKPLEKGTVKVSVRDVCSGARIEGASVLVDKSEKKTDSSGEAVFSDLPIGPSDVKVSKHFDDADYSTFVVHYPKVLRSYEAKSVGEDLVNVKSGAESKVRIEIEVYKVVGNIEFHRRHIDLDGEDKYGHWWTVIDDSTSFGWWPKYPLGSDENRFSEPPEAPAVLSGNDGNMKKIQHKFSSFIHGVHMKMYEAKESSVARTFRGVEGELNGVTSFKGKNRKGFYEDPHAGFGDEGDEIYQPVLNKCFELKTIKEEVVEFALGYSGGWSWRLEGGNHCHTFQKILMKKFELDKVKIIK